MNSTKFILCVLLFLFNIHLINAQITIDGTISDNESKPVGNVLVEIIDENDSNNTYQATTDDQGYYSIHNITEVPSASNQLPNEHIILRNYPNPFTGLLPQSDPICILVLKGGTNGEKEI